MADTRVLGDTKIKVHITDYKVLAAYLLFPSKKSLLGLCLLEFPLSFIHFLDA